jgi:hypothetical protein
LKYKIQKSKLMKKIVSLAVITFFTLQMNAQEVKAVAKEKAKKEACCSKKGAKAAMSAAEIEKCMAACKAKGKKCDASSAGKKC